MTKRFIVGFDGSENGDKALIWASRFAVIHDAEVVPVMAWQFPLVAMWPDAVGAEELAPASLQQANEEAAQAVLRDIRPSMADAPIADPIVERANAGKYLCQVAEELDADLLVLGSRGLGGFGGLMLGSVSAHCANQSPCPVAVIPEGWEPDRQDIGRVMVGVDESHNAELALEWADKWIPEATTLRLVHTWQLPITLDRFNNWIDPDTCAKAAEMVVDKAAATVRRHEVVAEAVQTDARAELASLAEGEDMLIVGARAHRGIGRLMMGSVASSVVHHLAIPTIIVRD